MDDGWLSELAWSHSAGGAQRLPGPWARQITSIALGKTRCEPYACERPVCACVHVEWYCFFLLTVIHFRKPLGFV